MTKADDLLNSLRSAGYRLTPQRVMILSAIASSSGHMTAEDIHEKVKKTYPFIDIATVYRTIQLLKKQRLLVEIDLGSGAYQYDPRPAPPPHRLPRLRLDSGHSASWNPSGSYNRNMSSKQT